MHSPVERDEKYNEPDGGASRTPRGTTVIVYNFAGSAGY
jgi:hypothetical protein